MPELIPLKNFGTNVSNLDGNLNVGEARITPLKGFTSNKLTVTQPEYETLLTPKQKLKHWTNFAELKSDDSVPMKVSKFIARMVLAPFKPLAQDIMEIHAVNEIAIGVQEGKYDPKILDELEVLTKKNRQIFGDVAQAVISVTPLKAFKALKGLPILSREALKIGAGIGLKTGAAFGAAEALSREELTPAELAFSTITGGAVGLVGGAVLTPLLRAPGAGLKKLITGKGLKPSLLEKKFTSFYERRLIKEGLTSADQVIIPPKLNFIEKLLEPLTPMRVLLAKDPFASKIGRNLSNGVRKTRRNLQVMYNDVGFQIVSKLKPKIASKVVALQEKGIKLNESIKLTKISDIKIRDGVKAIRRLNEMSLNVLTEALDIDTSKFRFNKDNYFPHMWGGKHVIQTFTEDPKTGKKVYGKIVAFAKDRLEGEQTILKYSELNPDVKLSLNPRSDLYAQSVGVTTISQSGFYKFIKQTADMMGSTVDEVKDEINMRGILAIKPGRTNITSLNFRKGELGDYTTDPGKVYSALFNKLYKKAFLDPEIRKSTYLLGKIKDSKIRQSASNLIDAVDDKYVHQLIPDKLTGQITKLQANLKMGYRVSPPIVNKFQPLYSMAISGVRNHVKAQALVFTKKGQIILDKIGVNTDVPLYEHIGVKKALRWFSPLYLFGRSEGDKYIGNRNVTALGAYFKAQQMDFKQVQAGLKKLKLPLWKNQSEYDIMFARSAVDATQFRYDVSDFPPLLRNNIGKVLLQFKTYGLNQLFNTYNVVRGKPLGGMELFYPGGVLTKNQQWQQRLVHFSALFAQGGVRALSFGAERVLPIGAAVWMATKAPALLYGVTALNGFDISASATIELNNLIQFLPYEDAKKVWEAVGEIKKGRAPRALLKTAPAAYRIFRALEAAQNEGNLKHFDTGKQIMQLTPREITYYGIGLNPLRVSQESAIHYYNYKLDKKHDEMLADATKDVIAALEAKDYEHIFKIIQSLDKEGLSLKNSQLINYFKDKNIDRLLRDFKKTRKEDKSKVFELISDFYK